MSSGPGRSSTASISARRTAMRSRSAAPALPIITAASPGSISALPRRRSDRASTSPSRCRRSAPLSLKPYTISNDVSLGGNQYFHTFGVGGEATAVAWNDFRLKSVFEFRNKNFNDAPDRPLSRGLTGSDKVFSLFVSKPITASSPNSPSNLTFSPRTPGSPTTRTRPMPAPSRIAFAMTIRLGFLRFPWETTLFGA